jgi:hypothetical protein
MGIAGEAESACDLIAHVQDWLTFHFNTFLIHGRQNLAVPARGSKFFVETKERF